MDQMAVGGKGVSAADLSERMNENENSGSK